jgi:hypothetical protein
MSFDRGLQITALTKRQAIVSGVLCYIVCLYNVCFIGCAITVLVLKA